MTTARVRLGLVKPGATAGRENVTFWKSHAPEGVEIRSAELGYRRGDRETFDGGWDRAARLAAGLAEEGCALIVVSGTPLFLLGGLEEERRWRKALSERIGVPVVTAMESHARALEALDAGAVAVATYYGHELNEAIATYLAHFDIEAVLLGGFSFTGEGEGLFSTPMHAQGAISQEDVYNFCAEGVRRSGRRVDAIYINGAGWDVAPVIDKLEADLGADVVWGPVAEIWLTYRILGISNPQPDCGALLREDKERGA